MNGMTLASASRLAVAARATSYGDKRSSKKGKSGGSEGLSDTEWMQKARKLANQRAAKFRTERGAPPVAPNTWRRKRKTDANDPYADGQFEAARGYDDLPPRSKRGEDEDEEEQEMTATKGDGLWRVDMAALSEEDWATQWTMTLEEFKALEKEVKANANDPQTALQAFEEAGLRRVSPDIAAGMLKMIADVAKKARTDREELAGLRRDSRVAHLLGTCVAAARRNSDALTPNKLSAAAWSLAIISGERANSAEMEVLAERAALVVSEMKPRACADLAWALASCRHASPAFFQRSGRPVRDGGFEEVQGVRRLHARVGVRAPRARLGRAEGRVRGLVRGRVFGVGERRGRRRRRLRAREKVHPRRRSSRPRGRCPSSARKRCDRERLRRSGARSDASAAR